MALEWLPLAAAVLAFGGTGIFAPEPRPDPPDLRPLTLATERYEFRLRPADVEAATVTASPEPALDLRVAPAAASWLAERTQAGLGETLVVSLCGQEIMRPVIRAPILDGTLRLAGDYDAATLETIAAVIRGDLNCDAYRLGKGGPDGQ
ncbi:hypothetical protein HKCCE3408_13055 [Rhodobacterales bacterium HKCCE3408]|nr:hypothetical protein [Rhodobacterales bacterium HKCCE3408]